MQIEKIQTQTKYPNIYAAGIVELIHIVTPRGAAFSFNRNASGKTWLSFGTSKPVASVVRAAEAA